jgi:hypothetical protein
LLAQTGQYGLRQFDLAGGIVLLSGCRTERERRSPPVTRSGSFDKRSRRSWLPDGRRLRRYPSHRRRPANCRYADRTTVVIPSAFRRSQASLVRACEIPEYAGHIESRRGFQQPLDSFQADKAALPETIACTARARSRSTPPHAPPGPGARSVSLRPPAFRESSERSANVPALGRRC